MRSPQDKIRSLTEAETWVRDLQKQDLKVVFTNGCFDLLHLGHLRYLIEARALGDALIIGVNSDRSVREIKGRTRPITPQDQRMEVLAGLETVDGVVLFDEPDPGRLIQILEPAVLVKGGDWPVERIVGRETVWARGGRVLNLPLTPGISTTGIIDRILTLCGPGRNRERTDP